MISSVVFEMTSSKSDSKMIYHHQNVFPADNGPTKKTIAVSTNDMGLHFIASGGSRIQNGTLQIL